MSAATARAGPLDLATPVAALAGADILVISAYFHPEPTGSAPPISDLAFWFAEHGARVRVLTTRPSYPQPVVLDGYRHGERDRETVRGVAVKRLNAHVAARRGLIGRLRMETSFLLRLAGERLGGATRPAEHVVCVCPSVFVAYAARWFVAPGGRSLCIVHDIQSGLGRGLGFRGARLAGRVLRAMERCAFERNDRLVALSEAMADELRGLGVRRPIIVAPPQIDAAEIRPRPEPAGPPILLYSGAMGRKQGLDQLLDLAERLAVEAAEAIVVVRGEGGERPELEAQARARGLTNLRFEDLAARERIAEAMAEGVVHLVPQRPDGASFAVPSKVFSIMAAERPFVATCAPDSPLGRIAAESGGGLCVAPYDAAGFARAVVSLLADPARRRAMGAAGRRHVLSHVDREVAGRRLWTALSQPE